jgi:hypothetical protein
LISAPLRTSIRIHRPLLHNINEHEDSEGKCREEEADDGKVDQYGGSQVKDGGNGGRHLCLTLVSSSTLASSRLENVRDIGVLGYENANDDGAANDSEDDEGGADQC